MGHADAPSVPDGRGGESAGRPFGDLPRRKVGLSDSAVATDGTVLLTSGLGSCLGVGLYHPPAGTGGLLHAMLPEAESHPGIAQKFVVEGIDALVAELAERGAAPSGLRAKLAGAAEMLELDVSGDGQSVGARNVAAAERALARHDVPIVAADTGGNRGRSLRFDTAEGRLHVVYAGGESAVL
ncbi:chemotaxis protein CheD [Halorarum halobium]|uniref:chemotaxis protein CheD n=1 Tax=Halorarum halobium TaxID=3075121 RepID=UPI0028AB74FB|nr:chemotaxis protein CheD [Halobaculum sp. XH14]